jgi:hypothetical protein
MFDLAVALHKTIDQIEAMTSRELSEWMAYSRIRPLPDAHWDSANVAHAVVSVMGGKAKFADFLPRPEAKKSPGAKVKLDAAQTRGLLSRICGRSQPGGGPDGR